MFPRRYLQILDCVSGEARRWGRYRAIECIAVVLALALGAAAVAAAVSVGPAPADLADGLVPGVPPDVDYGEVLPWLGFMLSGAAGMLWYSQWLLAKGS